MSLSAASGHDVDAGADADGVALLVIALPLGLLALAGLDVLETETAVDAGTWTIVISLGLITYLAIRRSHLFALAQVALLVVTLVFGAVVVSLQVLAHG